MEGSPVSADRVLRPSGIFSPDVIEDIQVKAELGRYRIRGFGTLRSRPLPSFDDLTFLPCTLTRIPLEGYREKCSTRTVLGTRYAARPIELEIPVMITGMSYGALSYNAKVALAQGATAVGTSTTTGDGGMLPAEREHSKILIYEVLPSRYGMNVHHLKVADGVELTVGQGAKPGTGGVLLGSKVSAEIARIRDLPEGVDQRSPARHPDWLGPDDLIIKIEELREATDWRVPIFVKMGATRVYDDVKLAAKAGADVIVVDGMEGGTGASPELLQDHTGIPTLAAVSEARRALEEMGLYGEVQLIIAGGIRNGTDAAKALALGADAVYIGTAALIALNCNRPLYVEDYRKLGAEPYACHHCHTGRCPVGITTQDPELMKRLPIDEAAQRVANFLHAMTLEIQMLARACGKADVHDLEPEDLRALTVE
ncbi:MAG: FMN-binding glutamate synthase family protein, partial [Candidatus Rokubacteria bacterium]|nr:FMN-binding glutamate synthase family protein [Candidatus Rokubacteria bacterium]